MHLMEQAERLADPENDRADHFNQQRGFGEPNCVVGGHHEENEEGEAEESRDGGLGMKVVGGKVIFDPVYAFFVKASVSLECV